MVGEYVPLVFMHFLYVIFDLVFGPSFELTQRALVTNPLVHRQYVSLESSLLRPLVVTPGEPHQHLLRTQEMSVMESKY